MSGLDGLSMSGQAPLVLSLSKDEHRHNRLSASESLQVLRGDRLILIDEHVP